MAEYNYYRALYGRETRDDVREREQTRSATPPTPTREVRTEVPVGCSLAMAYVPAQAYRNLYGNAEALAAGTLFRDLDFPFKGGKR